MFGHRPCIAQRLFTRGRASILTAQRWLTVCGRDDGAGAGSRPRPHENRPILGLRPRRQALGGIDPPGVAYVYASDRTSERQMSHLEGFTGILQVDGYAGYRKLARRNDVRLAFCWSHVRRGFYELATPGPSPTASEALQLIAELDGDE